MERKKASDFDPQLLSLFHKYVHGAISRREFLDGAANFAVGGLTATALWEMLRPNYALAQQVARDDKRTARSTPPTLLPRATRPTAPCAGCLPDRRAEISFPWFW